MPVNALRKPGARMSLQEALERVEKLKRLSQSSNEHEAALAAMRLKSFNIDAARTPREKTPETDFRAKKETRTEEHRIQILDALPDVPFETLDELEAHQPPEKTSVNWDELHTILLQKAHTLGADALANIQLKGTVTRKILAGKAIRFLTSQDLFEMEQANAIANEEEVLRMEAKERRDENYAPPVG